MTEIGEIKKILKDHESRILELETILNSGKSITKIDESSKRIPNDVLALIGRNMDDIKTPELIILILKFHGKLTKEKQIELSKKLGKKEADSMKGGNYNRDIVNKGLVHKSDMIGKDAVYELTEKGKANADEILLRLKKQV